MEGQLYFLKRALAGALIAVWTLPAQTGAPGTDGLVAGVGNFSHIVSNLDKSIEFYRDVLGLELSAPPAPFSPNPAIMKLGNTLGRPISYCGDEDSRSGAGR